MPSRLALWDTHAHLNLMEEVGDLWSIDENTELAGCICPAVDLASSRASLDWARRAWPRIGGAVGLHPQHEEEPWELFEALALDPCCVAIGETGLDRYHDYVPWPAQEARFRRHLLLAERLHLPVIVHMRESSDPVLGMLKEHPSLANRIVLHSFTASMDVAMQALDLGCWLSFSGILTFKNAGALREVAKAVPLDRMLIETDAPYLAPEPIRGQRNHPRAVVHIARVLADIKQTSMEALAPVLCANTLTLFSRLEASS